MHSAVAIARDQKQVETERTTVWEKIKIGILYLLPHHLITRLIYRLTRLETPLKDPLIKLYINFLGVDMHEALYPDPESYRSFNEFFTRSLKPGARKISTDPLSVCAACDGAILAYGKIEDGDLFQAKGRFYSLQDLFAGSKDHAATFDGGSYHTIYLSPYDYHRVHMPIAGRLKTMIHVPGRLFSVQEYGTYMIKNLYVRNERVIAVFDTVMGPLAIIMIGAIGVASMETVWSGLVTPANMRVSHTSYEQQKNDVYLQRGEEMGRFNLGSSVICLLANPDISHLPAVSSGMPVKMGEAVARLQTSASAGDLHDKAGETA